ncbi:MAG: beta-galactosidase, partial [Clostridia bacterium]|nr:beta-galactosidase [Clostridia bacterium]
MNNIPRNEHPRPDRHRESWLCLNGTWDFEIDNALVGKAKKFYERDSLDAKITVPFCPESRLSGVAHTDFMNAVWYRRDLDIPADWAGKRVIFHIDACDYKTTLYINGKKVGTHSGGYTSFQFDITDYLSPEGSYATIYAEDDLRSEKQVSGKQSHSLGSYGCYYTRTTGIWQTVW